MSVRQKMLAEFLGTALLLVVVVGSGIMGESLSQGNQALALLANSLATGAGLLALIEALGPISGAHFNPVVSWVAFLKREISAQVFAQFVVAQSVGAVAGVCATHIMFGQKLIQFSSHDRSDLRYVFSEIIATFLLILVLGLTSRHVPKRTPLAVALTITSAYWCTSSTSFANPAVSIARSLTDTFSGISLVGVPGFILAQMVGALLAFRVIKALS